MAAKPWTASTRDRTDPPSRACGSRSTLAQRADKRERSTEAILTTGPEDISARVARIARQLGAYRMGVASLEDPEISQAVRVQGDEQLASFPRAVSIAFRLQDSLVSRLPEEHRVPLVAKTYAFHVYKVVNAILDQTAALVAEALQETGYAAMSIPTSLSVDAAGFRGPLSHKLAARMAGLGWIGRSCLLVTPEAGPRVRFVTVLTDAPLSAGVPLSRDCEACTLCVEACPAGAFTGRTFDPAEPIEARMDVQACKDYRAEAHSESGTDICGVCVAVCPHGRRGGVSGRLGAAPTLGSCGWARGG